MDINDFRNISHQIANEKALRDNKSWYKKAFVSMILICLLLVLVASWLYIGKDGAISDADVARLELQDYLQTIDNQNEVIRFMLEQDSIRVLYQDSLEIQLEYESSLVHIPQYITISDVVYLDDKAKRQLLFHKMRESWNAWNRYEDVRAGLDTVGFSLDGL